MIGPEIGINARDLEQLRRAIERVPKEIRVKAMNRAMLRMRGMLRTYVVKEAAAHTKMPKEVIASLTTAHFNAGGNTSAVTVESGWIPLKRLGAVQSPSGVYVNTRGSYAHAFIATFKSGHVGVMRRVPGTSMAGHPGRERLRELFGPNPAHAINNDPDRYLKTMAEMIENMLYPRFAHEVEYILSQIGAR